MRKLLFIFVLPLLLMGCEAQSEITVKDLPKDISEFIINHFPENPVQHAIKEKDGVYVTYTILLEGNIHLEFDKKYKIIEMSDINGLPDSAIPPAVIEYVKNKYANNIIIGWELEKKRQIVELDNDVELEFDLDGNFIKIDID